MQKKIKFFWKKVLILAIEELNQEEQPIPKDHMEEWDVTGDQINRSFECLRLEIAQGLLCMTE